MKRASHLLLAIGIAALPVGIGAAMAAHGSATTALDGALAKRAAGQTQRLQDYFGRARSINLITAQNPAFSRWFELSGTRVDRLASAGPELRQINDALAYLETLYPDAIGEACFIDSAGAEIARVVRGNVATHDDLALDEAAAPFFAPTFALSAGEVYHAAPYVSHDTKEWVISNSTVLPAADGRKQAIVHFEITMESFRKTAADGSEFPVLIVDRATGHVVLDSRVPVREADPDHDHQGDPTHANHPHSAGDGQQVAALQGATSTSGSLQLDGKRAAYQAIVRTAGNANDWVIVAVAPSAVGPLYGVGHWPIVLGVLALAALALGLAGHRYSQRDLVQAATTDHLTGLANRRKFKADLAQAVGRASEEHQVLLVMYDLNGFKEYNDAFGHSAGDAMLSRMGRALRAALTADGTAYRLGGDEFCVIARIGADGKQPIIAAATAALRERGEGFHIDASYGFVVVPAETRDAAEAMHIADQRMYARKTSGRRSADRQTKDVLLRALYERHPELSDRFRMVADLSETLAERMGLGPEECRLIRQAAELHDIGKVAVPTEILGKKGPLTPEEWAFVRRHSVIGERILAAAPSLSYAAKLVRSANEWFDGSGYPDGLAGDEIPLGSRIIAVCDAFVAVTSHRPFAEALSIEKGVAEMRRCSGSQFDPHVVSVFGSVIGEVGQVNVEFEQIVSTFDTPEITS